MTPSVLPLGVQQVFGWSQTGVRAHIFSYIYLVDPSLALCARAEVRELSGWSGRHG